MNKKSYLMIVLLLLSAMVLVACGGNTPEEPAANATDEPAEEVEPTEEEMVEEEPIEEEMEEAIPTPTAGAITIWHGWDGAYYNEIEAIFNEYEEETGVDIELVRQDNLSDAMAVAVPAGEGPDILGWVQDQVGRNALVGNIVPVTEWITPDYLEANFEPIAVDAMIWQDDVWGIPESLEGIALVYNTDVISADMIPSDPLDFDGLLEAAQTFREENPDKYFLCNQGVGVTSEDAYHVAPIYFGFGSDDEPGFVDDEGTIYLDTPERLAAAEWLQELHAVSPEETSHEICQAGITGGNFGIWWTGPWAIASLEEAGVPYGISSFGRPFVGVKMLMMGANAVDRGNEAAVVDIMEYFGSAEVQTRLALVNGSVPANSEALNNPDVQATLSSSAFGEALNLGISMPNTPFIDAQWAPVGSATAAYLSGAQTPEEALAAAQATAEEIVEGMR